MEEHAKFIRRRQGHCLNQLYLYNTAKVKTETLLIMFQLLTHVDDDDDNDVKILHQM